MFSARAKLYRHSALLCCCWNEPACKDRGVAGPHLRSDGSAMRVRWSRQTGTRTTRLTVVVEGVVSSWRLVRGQTFHKVVLGVTEAIAWPSHDEEPRNNYLSDFPTDRLSGDGSWGKAWIKLDLEEWPSG